MASWHKTGELFKNFMVSVWGADFTKISSKIVSELIGTNPSHLIILLCQKFSTVNFAFFVLFWGGRAFFTPDAPNEFWELFVAISRHCHGQKYVHISTQIVCGVVQMASRSLIAVLSSNTYSRKGNDSIWSLNCSCSPRSCFVLSWLFCTEASDLFPDSRFKLQEHDQNFLAPFCFCFLASQHKLANSNILLKSAEEIVRSSSCTVTHVPM